MALIVGIEKITKTNKPTRNILIKFISEKTAVIFSPKACDKYKLAIGTRKKLKP